ncbi:Selenoprotein W-related protein OS=Bosea thiooxidans OX=53254 GN=SAMN05660750_03358 PE=4 SV=1 [Bosea thiooxidans]|uniref:Uncharacterized protein n=1 Tax=Bosea thiooxidans TaxID=53254 RepID=A0A1T5FMF4_9HYPH|nr:hypothetical protein [Bosea thiooxidans]SKB97325.1 hypothetical protein SAMN05660750_03358 [Bosea thiooxidans]
MKPWHHGLPETKQFVVFPPLGQELAFKASKERIGAHLRQVFPGLEFELADTGLYEGASVMPMCGTVGGPTSRMFAPPSEFKIREIETVLEDFDFGRTGLS